MTHNKLLTKDEIRSILIFTDVDPKVKKYILRARKPKTLNARFNDYAMRRKLIRDNKRLIKQRNRMITKYLKKLENESKVQKGGGIYESLFGIDKSLSPIEMANIQEDERLH